ncbi:hypothetical protein [Roseibacillus ishigakijimensis]|uniref:Uncharacterized protein n=1 Tax=Roseibacillus ishigakijimensis TaxID=454146 RepID=A0A934RRC7_9BACT|nr:hypothetical protein [Roseibacillus ishigakijimensis]
MERSRTPWWQWPNLLSLDAPLVAVAWLWMFSRFYFIEVQDPAVYGVLAGLVWVIYVVDRIRDASSSTPELRDRHHFHDRHRRVLLSLAALVFLASIVGFFLGVPFSMLWDWPRGYPASFAAFLQASLTHGMVVLGMAILFFFLGFRSNRGMDFALFKNGWVALTFAFGTAAGAHFYSYASVLDMITSFEALGFAFLCLMNLNAIELWEREEAAGEDYPQRDFLLSLPLLLIGGTSLWAALYWHDYHKPFYYSMLVASAALLMLDHFRVTLSARLLRVLADLALLLPLPIFWFWF